MTTEHDVIPSGYDREEDYFHQQDLELIQKKRAELDAVRKEREAEQQKMDHWMKCPKCGRELEEVEMEGVMVDRCTGCQGIYFDKGEVEIMLETRRTWKNAAKKLFGK